VQLNNDRSFFTSKSNSFKHDTYYLANGPLSQQFQWLDVDINKTRWQADGQETTGSFNGLPKTPSSSAEAAAAPTAPRLTLNELLDSPR
jgi:hypothetical protein